MKRPEYVAAAVTACRNVLDGKKPDMDSLRAVFSRSGFTQSYYNGTLADMQGIRTKEDVQAAGSALAEMKRLYDKPYKRRTVDMTVTVRKGQPVSARVICGGISLDYVSEIVPETAEKRAVTADEIAGRLRKTGGTVYEVGAAEILLDDGLMLTAAAVNSVRREVLARLDDELAGRHTDK